MAGHENTTAHETPWATALLNQYAHLLPADNIGLQERFAKAGNSLAALANETSPTYGTALDTYAYRRQYDQRQHLPNIMYEDVQARFGQLILAATAHAITATGVPADLHLTGDNETPIILPIRPYISELLDEARHTKALAAAQQGIRSAATLEAEKLCEGAIREVLDELGINAEVSDVTCANEFRNVVQRRIAEIVALSAMYDGDEPTADKTRGASESRATHFVEQLEAALTEIWLTDDITFYAKIRRETSAWYHEANKRRLHEHSGLVVAKIQAALENPQTVARIRNSAEQFLASSSQQVNLREIQAATQQNQERLRQRQAEMRSFSEADVDEISNAMWTIRHLGIEPELTETEAIIALSQASDYCRNPFMQRLVTELLIRHETEAQHSLEQEAKLLGALASNGENLKEA